jgi:hypothetical protein
MFAEPYQQFNELHFTVVSETHGNARTAKGLTFQSPVVTVCTTCFMILRINNDYFLKQR